MSDTEKTIQLLDLSRAEMLEHVRALGQPSYRADQVRQWLYKQLVTDPAQMTSLPLALREQLAAESGGAVLTPVVETHSSDGQTTKVLFRLHDGQLIETVLMRYHRRNTVCISSQAGCAMGCTFCATALMGLQRNLTAGEIVAQVLYFQRWLQEEGEEEIGKTGKGGKEGEQIEDMDYLQDDVGVEETDYRSPITDHGQPQRVTNVVVMGMGEPLANYGNLWKALHNLVDADGFGLGARHVTVSTVGLVPAIDRFAEEPLQVNLAVSLHAPNDALRAQLAPINDHYPIAEVMDACRRYIARTNRRISFEYAMMRGINDSQALAVELAALLRGLLCHVNLIPLNPVKGSPYQPSTREDVDLFMETLRAAGISATLRVRRGIDIDAGCGQLRARVESDSQLPQVTGT